MDFSDALGVDLSADQTAETIIRSVTSAEAPVVTALVAVPDPALICEKLLRLQRYCSIVPRLEIAEVTAQAITLAAGRHDEPPDLKCAAILQGVLERAGFKFVSAQGREIRWKNAPGIPTPPPCESAQLTDHLVQLIASDLSRAWRIEDAALHLGLSTRSLQRYLHAEGGTFSVTLRQARTDRAAALLRTSSLSLAEVGFYCGYADQAHFQREFHRQIGTTPRKYRIKQHAQRRVD
ncbi:helix-turn-helix transcriptional regulator [Tritonibacter scottomollicae]|uniref:helix-turn-helix transcriptional regulator n=1 Tax=Tritonibacter scottomollicae TaxID=483013 RepID=UPI003AA984C0